MKSAQDSLRRDTEVWVTPTSSPSASSDSPIRAGWTMVSHSRAERRTQRPVAVLCASQDTAQTLRGWLAGHVGDRSIGGQWRVTVGAFSAHSGAPQIQLMECGAGAANAAAAAAVCCCGGTGVPVSALIYVGRSAVDHRRGLRTGDVIIGTHTFGLDLRGTAAAQGGARIARASNGTPSSTSQTELLPPRQMKADAGLLSLAFRAAASQERLAQNTFQGGIGSSDAWPLSTSSSVQDWDQEAPTTILPLSVHRGGSSRVPSAGSAAIATDFGCHAAATVCRSATIPFLAVGQVQMTPDEGDGTGAFAYNP